MNPLVTTIQQQLLAEASAAAAQIAAGGEIIIRGVTIRHYPEPNGAWFVEVPLPKTGKHESADRRQYNRGDLGRVIESVAYNIEKRLRTEHKTPEAVSAAIKTPIPLMRVYRSMNAPHTRICIYQDGRQLVYELTGQGVASQADTSTLCETDLLTVLLDPMGLTVHNGWIVSVN